MNLDETTVYVLGFYVGYVAARSFSRIGCSEMECAALGSVSVTCKPGVKCRLGSLVEINEYLIFPVNKNTSQQN